MAIRRLLSTLLLIGTFAGDHSINVFRSMPATSTEYNWKSFELLPEGIKQQIRTWRGKGPALECLITAAGMEYYGRMNKTKSGRTCQRWSSQTPHQYHTCHGYATEDNYCRNNFGDKAGCIRSKPWCYTTDPNVRWELCYIPLCTPWRLGPPLECLLTPTGQEYQGLIRTTRSGLTCQMWNSHEVHEHNNCPGEGSAENFCSNAFAERSGCMKSKPWCYTADPEKKWQLCDIPMCHDAPIARTFDGNGDGAPCVFPFIHGRKEHTRCTLSNENMPWCATTSNYDRDKKWGYCRPSVYTFKFNGGGSTCVFPFVYRGVTYYECALTPAGAPWCATTKNFALDQKWGYCQQAARTFDGNDGGAPCVFPFISDGAEHDSCILSNAKMPWCATTPDYDRDKKWGYCRRPVYTFKGNGGGRTCAFPFIFHDMTFYECTIKGKRRPWCSVTKNFGHDKKWGFCQLTVTPRASHSRRRMSRERRRPPVFVVSELSTEA